MTKDTIYTKVNSNNKDVLHEPSIPFSVNNDPFYSEDNIAFLKEGIQALNSGKGTPHELIDVNNK